MTFTPTDTTDYKTTPTDTTIVVAQATTATPTITWASPASIVYGTALSAAQLDATANVAGTFAYSPAAGTVLGAGTQTLSVTFTPTDTTDYKSASADTTIAVAQATPMITWAAPASIVYGTALSATQLDATADVPGTFVFSPPVGTVLEAGTHTLAVTFTPTDGTDYTTANADTTIVVAQATTATPTITWASPASIVYGAALSATQLDATSNIPGTFAYSPPVGTVLGAGTHSLAVIFTPTDTTDFTTASADTTIVVAQAMLTIAWPDPAGIGYGMALSATQLDATASVPGTFAYTPASGTVLGAGTHTLSATFTPTDATDYATATAGVTIVVAQAAPTIIWASPAGIVFGTALSSAQLDATASVAGGFSYSPAAGDIPGAGVQTLSVTFTPVDSRDYSSVRATTTIRVARTTPTVNVGDTGGVYNGSPSTAAASLAGIDGVSGPSLEAVSPTLMYYAGSSATGTPLNGPPTAAGTYTVVADFPGSTDYASALSPPATFAITPAADSISLESSSAGSTEFGQPVTLVATVTSESPGAETPTGTVTFYEGTTAMAAVPLDVSGRATLIINSLGLGDYSFTAVYGGEASSVGARSIAVSQSVAPADTHVVLVPHAVRKRKKIAALGLTAEVGALAPGGGVPTGVVTFMRKKRTLGTAALSDGQATLTVKPKSILNKSITIIYGGETGYRPSSLGSLKLTNGSLATLTHASLERSLARRAGHARSHDAFEPGWR